MKLLDGNKMFTKLADDLVPVYTTDFGEKVVYGRELHEKLGVSTRYNDWVNRRISECDAIENEDFEVVDTSANLGKNDFYSNLSKIGRPQVDHIIKIEIAKEMAMLERNDKGKQVRRYFIEVEKKYKENKEENKKFMMPCLL